MTHIVAIGGGEFRKDETRLLDQLSVDLCARNNPKLLFIPTASSDAEGYITDIHKYFHDHFNCEVASLRLSDDRVSKDEITDQILSTDIIYVGGGNTKSMLETWRKKGVDKLLRKAWQNGIIMTGLSAGAICWVTNGCSDSNRFEDENAPLINLTGLGLVDMTLCPHFDSEPKRRPGFKEMLKTHEQSGIALEDGVALHITDQSFKVISQNSDQKAYHCQWSSDRYTETELEPNKWHALSQFE